MTIHEKVVTAISGLGYPYATGVYRVETGSALPDLFLVITLVSSAPEISADDGETLRAFRVQVAIWSRSGVTEMASLDAAMVGAGFVRSNVRDLPYDTVTRHFGQAREFVFLNDL